MSSICMLHRYNSFNLKTNQYLTDSVGNYHNKTNCLATMHYKESYVLYLEAQITVRFILPSSVLKQRIYNFFAASNPHHFLKELNCYWKSTIWKLHKEVKVNKMTILTRILFSSCTLHIFCRNHINMYRHMYSVQLKCDPTTC